MVVVAAFQIVTLLRKDKNTDVQTETVAPIIGEDVEDRNENSKTFIRKDGSYTKVISLEPIHYYDDENGSWLDIDNSLVPFKDKTGEAYLTNSQNSFEVVLPQTMKSGNNVTIKNGDYEVQFSFNNLKTEAFYIEEKEESNEEIDSFERLEMEKKQSSVKYQNVMEETDVEYVILPKSLKENIVIKEELDAPVDFTYTLSTNQMTPVLNKDGSISLMADDKEVFFITVPYMFDEKDAISAAIEVALSENEDGSYELTYTPSLEWLTEKSRAYPVTIDPTLQIRSNNRSVEANVGNPVGTNFTSYSYIQNYSGNPDISAQYLIKILDSYIPSNMMVSNATLRLMCKDNSNDSTYDNHISAYMATDAWDAQTTATVDTSGMTALDCQTIAPGAAEVSYYWDVTAAVGLWGLKEATNHGFILSANESTDKTNVTVRNSTNLSTQLPVLTISYRVDNGFDESLFTYHSVDMGKAGTAYINEYNRTFSLFRDEISLEGNLLPVSISRTFNSTGTTQQNAAGKCWSFNYYSHIMYSASNLNYSYYGDDGKVFTFINSGETDSAGRQKFIPDDASVIDRVLWRNAGAAGTDYANIVLERSDGINHYFNSIGRLKKIEDTNSSVVLENNISYISASSVTFTKITDGENREFRFYLSSFSGVNGFSKIQVYDAGGNPITINNSLGDVNLQMLYEYENIGGTLYLTKAIYPDGEYVLYGYDTAGNMTSVTDADGSKLTVTYNQNRVTGYTKTVYDAQNETDVFESSLSINVDTYNQRTFTTTDASNVQSSQTVEYDSSFNPVGSLTLAFTDRKFLEAVRDRIDKPRGTIYAEDLEGVTYLNVNNKGIRSLAGLEHFTELEQLYCQTTC